MTERPTTYLTHDTDADLDRIKLQSRGGDHNFNEQTEQFLKELNLPSNARVLVPGVGRGEELSLLAKNVKNVNLIAVDSDPARLITAREVAKEFGIEDRVEFREGNLVNLPLENESIDIVYSRLLLQHLTQETRIKGGQEMMRVLKSGGLALAEDITVATWEMTPQSEAHNILKRAFLASYGIRGTNPSMGKDLPAFWQSLGLVDIKAYERQIESVGNDPFKNAHLAILRVAKQGILATGMADVQFEELMGQFKNDLFAEGALIKSPVMTQIIGVKS